MLEVSLGLAAIYQRQPIQTLLPPSTYDVAFESRRYEVLLQRAPAEDKPSFSSAEGACIGFAAACVDPVCHYQTLVESSQGTGKGQVHLSQQLEMERIGCELARGTLTPLIVGLIWASRHLVQANTLAALIASEHHTLRSPGTPH